MPLPHTNNTSLALPWGDGTTKCCPRCLYRIIYIYTHSSYIHMNHVNYEYILLTAEPVAIVCSMTNTNGGNVSQSLGAAVTKESISGQRNEDFSIKRRHAQPSAHKLLNERPCFVYGKSVYLSQDLKILVTYYLWNCGLTYWGFLLKRCFLIDFVFCLYVLHFNSFCCSDLSGARTAPRGKPFLILFAICKVNQSVSFHLQHLMPSAAY